MPGIFALFPRTDAPIAVDTEANQYSDGHPHSFRRINIMNKLYLRLAFYTVIALEAILSPTSAHASMTLYVSNSSGESISSIDSVGFVSTSTITGLHGPNGLAFDSVGRLYQANTVDGSLRTINRFSAGGIGYTFVNSGIDFPAAMAFDGADNLYVADYGNGKIIKFAPNGDRSIFASTPDLLNALAFDGSGNLYASVTNQTIMKYTTGGVGSVFANTPPHFAVQGLAFDTAGNLFAAMTNGENSRIDKFNTSGGVSTFATNVSAIFYGLAFDGADNLYVANYGSNMIEKFTPDGVGSIFANTGLDRPTYIAFGDVGNASDFTLIAGIPEPSRLILLLGSACSLLMRRRRSPAHN
jgi:sugar lactone lactonase YvrE